MKFGIFYEHQLPRPWTEDSEHRLLKQSLDQIELADRLGYDYAWEVEHHFLEEYSHSSAPEVFLGAASQRTKNIRLGHGIIQLTTNHPARVAEKVATLDLVSDGRVELGLGEGACVTELHPFNLRFRDKRDVWEDAVRCDPADVLEPRLGIRRRVLPVSAARRGPETAAEAASAALGRLLAARHHPICGPSRHGRPVLQVRRPRLPPGPGSTPTTTPSSITWRSWPTTRPIPTSPWCPASCAARRTRKPGKRPTAGPSSSSPCSSTTRKARSSRARSASGTNTRSGSRRRPARGAPAAN